jgi:hypothetical protein
LKPNLSCFSRIQAKYLPTELSDLIERDLAEYKKQKDAESQTKEEDDTTVTVTTVTTTTTTKTEKTVKKNAQASASTNPESKAESLPVGDRLSSVPDAQNVDTCAIDPGHVPLMLRSSSPPPPPPPPPPGSLPSNNIEIFEDENLVYLGLRVYTNKEAPAKVSGKLRSEMDDLQEQRMSRSPIRTPYRSRSRTSRR